MSNHSPKVDAISWLLFLVSLVAIVLTVYVLVTSLIHTVQNNSTKGEVMSTSKVSSVADNLKPVGTSATSDTPVAAAAAPTSARSGEEVYGAVCSVCHKTGVAGAPKIDDKAAWEPRVATGLDALLATAVKGKGAMPPRAGQNVGDEELKAAILFMTKKAGFDLGGAAPAAEAPAKTEEKPVAAEEPKAEPVAETKEEPKAPEQPAAPAAPAMAAAATTAVAATAAATTATEAAPAAVAEVVAPAATGGDGAALYVSKGCGACHGADAKTPIMPLYPKIAGQSTTYVTTQMTDIKSGKRNNGQTAVMKGIMAGVSDEEITAIAAYISGL